VIKALAGSSVPVPETLAFCDDVAVNGAPFYVMEKVDGRILRTQGELADVKPDDALRCSEALVDVLAALHSVDYEAIGLGDFGRPDGFVARNVRRWGKQWQASREAGCPDNPAIDELARRLQAELPPSPAGTIVHGDYRLDNTMLANDDVGRIVAVLDWEMSTLGDPLTDLGLFLLYWGRGEAQVVATGAVISPDLGFLTRDEVIDRYARASGADLTWLDWYEVFASYKLAIIVAGIHARFLMGMTRGDGFDHMGEMVAGLANGALDFAGKSEIASLRA
jgi:aminoglycoside phosphotransferase (APT) family kinase protein